MSAPLLGATVACLGSALLGFLLWDLVERRGWRIARGTVLALPIALASLFCGAVAHALL